MITVNIKLEAIEYLIKSLKPKDRVHLFRHLGMEELWRDGFRNVTANMRRSIRQKGITDKDIDRICEQVRKEHYERDKRCV